MADEKNKPENKSPTDRPKAFPIPTPIPDGDSSIYGRPDDDDAVDFGQLPANASGSAALSHSQISGPLSGTSVIAWTDLMKARAEEEAKLQYDSLDNIDLDATSDQDLLAHALASEPPSGKLNIPSDDRPHGSLSKEFIALDAQANSPRQKEKDDESVLPTFSIEDQASSILADSGVRDKEPASKLNLAAKHGKDDDDDAFTDAMDLGQPLLDSGESSAVDLGSEPVIDLPFPSSGNLSSGTRSKSNHSSARRRRGDSSTVDLLTGTGGNGLSSVPGITAIGSSMRPDSGLPVTRRIDVVSSRNGWLGGGLVGGLTGVAVCVGIWLSGALSPKAQESHSPPPSPVAVDPAITALRSAMEQAKLDVNDPAGALAKLVQDKSNADAVVARSREEKQTLMDNQKSLETQLAAAQSSAKNIESEKKAVDSALQSAKDELKDKETERQRLDDELKAAKAQMATAKTTPVDPPPAPPITTPPPTKNNDAELAKLKEQVETLQNKSAELEKELSTATRSSETLKQTIRDMGSFVVAVRQRLQAPTDAKPNELLTNLDSVLATKPAPELGTPLPGSIGMDPRADRAFHRGLNFYRTGSLADAERELQTAVKLQNRDARLWYLLGLTQQNLGQSDKAAQSFQQARDREQRNLPTPDAVDAMLERMPPETRRLINQVRGRS